MSMAERNEKEKFVVIFFFKFALARAAAAAWVPQLFAFSLNRK